MKRAAVLSSLAALGVSAGPALAQRWKTTNGKPLGEIGVCYDKTSVRVTDTGEVEFVTRFCGRDEGPSALASAATRRVNCDQDLAAPAIDTRVLWPDGVWRDSRASSDSPIGDAVRAVCAAAPR